MQNGGQTANGAVDYWKSNHNKLLYRLKTPRKANMEPEIHAFEKEKHWANPYLVASMLVSRNSASKWLSSGLVFGE